MVANQVAAARRGGMSGTERADEHMNVGGTERMVSVIAGAGLAALGLSRRSLGGLLVAAVGGALIHRGATGRCRLYEAMGVDTAHPGSAEPHDFFERGIHVEEAVTIERSPDELYQFWRNFENLPRFMNNLDRVEVRGDGVSHWVARGPGGTKVEWDAQIINEQENELIAWKATENSDVPNTGSVRFVPAPGGRGTQVKVRIEYLPPAGKVGRAVARMLGESPEQQVREDLRRFKQLMESGEIPTTHGQPAGAARAHKKPTPRDKSQAAGLADRAGATQRDVVQEASEQSFPASDAPGWSSASI